MASETHEPDVPRNWPHGHVGVELTDNDQDECIAVTVHGIKHYLHSTTVRELSNMLPDKLEELNGVAARSGFAGFGVSTGFGSLLPAEPFAKEVAASRGNEVATPAGRRATSSAVATPSMFTKEGGRRVERHARGGVAGHSAAHRFP